MSPHLARIVREAGVEGLLEALSETLSPTDLQSLLLEVYRLRAEKATPNRVLERFESDRFVKTSQIDPRRLLEFDGAAFALAAPEFEPIELGPVCPLGTVSAIATMSQNCCVPTARNTEVVSDLTNVMALECAVRRRTDRSKPVRLCASHRLLRAQQFPAKPGFFAHFRVFGLVTAGRDSGSFKFEIGALVSQISVFLRLLESFSVESVRVLVTPLDEARTEGLESHVIRALAQTFPKPRFSIDRERTTGRGYYRDACFQIHATDPDGQEHFLVDGGFTDWTQKLVGDRKERLMISGMGSERFCGFWK